MRFSAAIRAGLTTARAFQLFQLFRQGGLILIAVALARAPLSVAQVGNYEMLTYLGYLLTFFWANGFLQGLLSQYPTLADGERRGLIFQAFALFTGFAAALGLVLWFARSGLLPLLVQRTELAHLGLFLVFLVTHLTAGLQEHFYLLEERKKSLVAYGFVATAAQLGAVALPPWLGYDFYYSFVGLAVVGALKWLWLAGYVLRHGRVRWSGALARTWWRISWPLALYALVGGLNQSLGPWLVGYFFAGDPEQFALYRYGARELPLLSALAGALGSAMIAAIARERRAGLLELRGETSKLYHLIFPISIGLMLSVHWWFPLVFTEKYAAAVPLFRIFLLLTASHLLFARTILVAERDTKIVPVFAAVGLLLQLGLGFVLVPRWQLAGITFAAVFAYAIEKLLFLIYVRYRHGLAWTDYTPWRWWVFYTAGLVGSYFLLAFY